MKWMKTFQAYKYHIKVQCIKQHKIRINKQFYRNNAFGSYIVTRHTILENMWYELWEVKYLSLSPTCTHTHTQEETCSHFRDFNVRRPNLGNTLQCNTKSLSSLTASTHFIYQHRKDIRQNTNLVIYTVLPF